MESSSLRSDLQDQIPWFERRGVARCGFDRKNFRIDMLMMAAVATSFGVVLLVRGQGWGSAAGMFALCIGVFGGVMGMVLARTARCVVEVDFDRSEFRLHHFVYPLGFWDIREKPLVTVPFDEIRGVSLQTSKRGREAFIGTRRSRFVLSEDIEEFGRIVQLAEELAGPEGNAAVRTNTLLRIWVPALIGGGVCGLVIWVAWTLGWV
jgi:hypothetical protein